MKYYSITLPFNKRGYTFKTFDTYIRNDIVIVLTSVGYTIGTIIDETEKPNFNVTGIVLKKIDTNELKEIENDQLFKEEFINIF